MSIVLLVIALISGGCGYATQLIKGANRVTVLSEVERYRAEIREFRDYYGALPGDFSYAGKFWGHDCKGNFSTEKDICSGDGDEIIRDNTEGYRAWQHLYLAGFGSFAPTSFTLRYKAAVGRNVPKSVMRRAAYQILGDSRMNESYAPLKGADRNFLRLAGQRIRGNLMYPLLTPSDAFNLDKKVDDGKADRGYVYADNGRRAMGKDSGVQCISGRYPNTYYKLTNDQVACYLQFSING